MKHRQNFPGYQGLPVDPDMNGKTNLSLVKALAQVGWQNKRSF
jgi:hypothetical protein